MRGGFLKQVLDFDAKEHVLGFEGEANERLVPDPPSAVDEDDGFGFSVKSLVSYCPATEDMYPSVTARASMDVTNRIITPQARSS